MSNSVPRQTRLQPILIQFLSNLVALSITALVLSSHRQCCAQIRLCRPSGAARDNSDGLLTGLFNTIVLYFL